jgi:6-phosphogluconolactonase
MRHRPRELVRLFLLVGLSGGALRASAQPYVYVANSNGSSVSGYRMGATGALTPLTPPVTSVGSAPYKIAVTPNGLFAYVTNHTVDTVSAYAITPTTGAWIAVPGSPFATGSGPGGVAVHPEGTYLYVANQGGDSISAYSIAANGALTPVAGSPFPAGDHPVAVAVTPFPFNVYVTNNTAGLAGSVSGYAINVLTGALAAIQGSPYAAGDGPSGLAIAPNGVFVYVANANSGTISAYAANPPMGILQGIPGSPFNVGQSLSEMAITPNGAFAYVVSPLAGTYAYTVNPATGGLTAVPGSPFGSAGSLSSIAISPDGTVVYVTNGTSLSGSVSAYTIDASTSTGALSEIAGSPFAAGPQPYGVAIANPTVAIAPPTITMTFGAASIAFGGMTSLTFTLQNNNASTLTGVGFTDTLPAGLVVSTPNALGGSCDSNTITAGAGSGSVSLASATLAAASSCTFSVNVTGTTLGPKNNVTGAVSSVEGGVGGTASASVTVTPVTSFTGPTATGSGTATVSFTGGTPECQFTSAAFIPLTGPSSPPTGSAPAGIAFPHGLLDYRTGGCAIGGTLDFTVVYPQPLPPNSLYWIYGPTAGVPSSHWYTIPANVAGSTVRFSIADGGSGDNDLTADGAVFSIGGPGAPVNGTRFYPLPPCRVGDTRRPIGPLDGPALQPGATRSFAVAGVCGIPAGAVAISANLTVTNVGAAGELVVFPSDVARPTSSSISFVAHRTRANNDFVLLSGSDTSFSVFNNSTATVDFILDVNGYFQ